MSPQSVDQGGAKSAAPPAGKVWRVGTLTYTRAGLVVLFCWLLWGDFAWSMKERAVFPVMQVLLNKFHASDMVAALLMGSLPQAVTMMVSPIIAYKSDRHRGRWGRRIPFLLIPTPIVVLAMIGLAFSPGLGRRLDVALGIHSPGLNPSILILFGLFWTLFEFGTMTGNAVFTGLVNDVVPDAVIGRFYGMFRALSLIAGAIFFFWLLGIAETWYRWIFFGIAALYGAGFTIMCLKVREGEYPPPPPVEPGKAGGFLSAAKSYFRECFTHSYYLWFFGAIALSWMSFVPANLFNVSFAKSIPVDMRTYGKYVALTYFISIGLSYVMGSLADRFHPLRVGLAVQVLYAVATLWGGCLQGMPGRFRSRWSRMACFPGRG